MLSPSSAMMQRSPNGLQQQSPSSAAHPPVPGLSVPASAPRPASVSTVRPTLPDRNVTANDIEEAYVRFILYCNPAVPLETDTVALRESFRTPPKSGGKTFSTFLLFQLIQQLETKDIKTWAELALKLGVEPPDQDKGQSSQKIQQYAVRLKRWMHSMHLDAFFEYLMNRPHPYWTQIPNDPSPICDAGRDGVAAEDDMALRALLPHIRPKRGRKRPDDDDSRSPSQKPRLDSPSTHEESGRHGTLGPWSAHPDSLRSNTGSTAWPSLDMAQTPLTAYPQSAITPSTRATFWADEPRSAISPPKMRSASRRHGAKVVSSAWRSGPGSSGKTRGRPPINRTPIDTQLPPFPSLAINRHNNFGTPDTPTFAVAQQSTPTPPTLEANAAPAQGPGQIPTPTQPFVRAPPPTASQPPVSQPPISQPPVPQAPAPHPPPPAPRPAKPSISLQVPTRPTGSVRLATPPPPVVMVNGQAHASSAPMSAIDPTPPIPAPEYQYPPIDNNPIDVNIAELNFNPGPDAVPPHPQRGHNTTDNTPSTPQDGPANLFDDMTDRTNIDPVVSHLVYEIMAAEWVDTYGNPAECCSVEEAHAIVISVMESLYKEAASQNAFLMRLAALVGGKVLMSTSKMRFTRSEKLESCTKYATTWEYRLGHIRRLFHMTHTVGHDKWKPPWADDGKKSDERSAVESEAEEKQDAKYWKKKYEDLAGVLSRREKGAAELQANILSCMRDARSGPGL